MKLGKMQVGLATNWEKTESSSKEIISVLKDLVTKSPYVGIETSDIKEISWGEARDDYSGDPELFLKYFSELMEGKSTGSNEGFYTLQDIGFIGNFLFVLKLGGASLSCHVRMVSSEHISHTARDKWGILEAEGMYINAELHLDVRRGDKETRSLVNFASALLEEIGFDKEVTVLDYI